MSRERRLGDYRRIGFILDLANKGLPHDQVYRELAEQDSRRKSRLADKRRGAKNEAKVAGLLSRVSYVEDVERTESFSPEDMAGYDLYVYLQGIDPLDAVGVQVKSSQGGINRFMREHVREPYLKRRGEDGFRSWLVSRRLVMINGSLTDREIIDSFVSQVEDIGRRARIEQSQQSRRR